VLIIIFLSLFFAISIFIYKIYVFSNVPIFQNNVIKIDIMRGEQIKNICKILANNGLTSSANMLYWYLRLVKIDKTIQAGYFIFHGSITPKKLVELLQIGYKKQISITFPEGITKNQIAIIISNAGLLSYNKLINCFKEQCILNYCKVPKISNRLNSNIIGGIEGYLFPDTYFFSNDETSYSIVKKMNNRLKNVIDRNMYNRMKELKLNLHQILTLASMIEKETGLSKEKHVISSVFHNRLKYKMKLQSDPTIIYGIQEFNGKIGKKHILQIHPYNTYQISGLPPGPIGSPGISAINAALWPTESKYLYFVSKNDGSHIFCKTLKCHNKAVKKWQITSVYQHRKKNVKSFN
jgi:UPF0755 protein